MLRMITLVSVTHSAECTRRREARSSRGPAIINIERVIGIAIGIGIEIARIDGEAGSDSDSDSDFDALHDAAADIMRIAAFPAPVLDPSSFRW